MLQKIKDWMMPLAMLTGGVFYQFFVHLSWMTPYLIFFMLLFTFSKLSPRGIGFSKLHGILLFLQLAGGIAAYFLCLSYGPVVAQGALICFLAPTATAAAVITGMLGGNVNFLTSFTLLSNLAVAIVAPLFFSMGGINTELSFWGSFNDIFVKVFPLLIMPLLAAWTIRFAFPKVQQVLLRYSKVPFYLWALALTIVTGRTVASLVVLHQEEWHIAFVLGGVSLVICCLQFVVGKQLGARFDNRIAAGQALGQKNTILAIWMSQVFLNPVSALAPSCYIIWQNTINSWQLWKARRRLS